MYLETSPAYSCIFIQDAKPIAGRRLFDLFVFVFMALSGHKMPKYGTSCDETSTVTTVHSLRSSLAQVLLSHTESEEDAGWMEFNASKDGFVHILLLSYALFTTFVIHTLQAHVHFFLLWHLRHR